MSKNLNNKGFSLMEILVALTILALLTTILVPSYIGLIATSRLKKDYTKYESVCTAFKISMAQPEVQLEINELISPEDAVTTLQVICQIGDDGQIDFGNSELVGTRTFTLDETELWANAYQTIGQTYESEYSDNYGQFIIFTLIPKTASTTADCAYAISPTR